MRRIHVGVGHQDAIVSVVFSPDGQRLLSGSFDGTAKIWDVSNGELLRTLFWDNGPVNAVAWSPDGAMVAVAGDPPDGPEDDASKQELFPAQVRLFDPASGRQILAIVGYGEGVAFSPDRQRVAVVDWGRIAVFEIASGLRLAQCEDSGNSDLRNVFYSSNGERLGCLTLGGVLVFDSQTASPLDAVTDASLFDGSTDFDARFRVAHAAPEVEGLAGLEHARHRCAFWQQTLADFRPNQSADAGMELQRIAFSADGRFVAVQCGGESWSWNAPNAGYGVLILDCPNAELLRFIPSPGDSGFQVRTIAFSPDSRLLAVAGDSQTISLWEVDTGREIRRIGLPPPAIRVVACSPTAPLVAAGTAAGTVVICATDVPAVLGLREMSRSPIIHAEFLSGGELVLFAARDGTVYVCRSPGLQPVVEFRQFNHCLLGGIVSSDGQRFIGVGYPEAPQCLHDPNRSARIVLNQLADGGELGAQDLPVSERITSIAASPSRQQLAISTWKTLLLTDIGDQIKTRIILTQKANGIQRVAFVPGGGELLIANEGYGMRVLETSGAPRNCSIVATRDGPTALAFSHDGSHLVRSTAFFREIELIDKVSGELKGYFHGHQSPVTSLAVSPNDEFLVSGGADGTVKLWDFQTRVLKASIVTLPETSHPCLASIWPKNLTLGPHSLE